MTAMFKHLAPGEEPELGLFFIEDAGFLASLELGHTPQPAAGMAFLITDAGVLVTASHVPLLIYKGPGDRVNVYGVAPSVCVVLQAEVLSEGWLGPVAPDGQPLLDIPQLEGPRGLQIDNRPDVFRQDVCFLKLLPETVTWHVRGNQPEPGGSAGEVLLARSRVLPLGLITNRSKNDDIRCWTVIWEQLSPECHFATPKIDGIAPEQFDAVRFTSDEMRPGFSGSPLWHLRRRVVVGVHRRGVRALPGARIAADTRALLRVRGDLFVAVDRRIAALLDRPRGDVNAGTPPRYPEFAHWDNPECIAEQRLVKLTGAGRGRISSEAVPEAALHCLASLLTSDEPQQVLLQGAPGAGKSTLLRRVAQSLADQARKGGQWPLVPLLVSARELVEADLNLRQVLNAQLARLSPVDSHIPDVLDCVEESGARLVLLIDGLDEVSTHNCTRILGALLWRRRVGLTGSSLEPRLVHHVLLASRPTDQVHRVLGPERADLHRYRLELLDANASLSLAESLVGALDYEAQRQLENGLRDLRLTSRDDGATPLQVWMAAFVFKHSQHRLPKRPLDLIDDFVKIVTAGAWEYIEERLATRDSKLLRNLDRSELPKILGLIAHVFAEQRTQVLSEKDLAEWLEKTASDSMFPWLADIDKLLRLLFEYLPSAIGVLTVTSSEVAGAQLSWTHATFTTYFSAAHVLDISSNTVGGRRRLFSDLFSRGDHWPALSLLSEMERRKEFGAVAAIIDDCLDAPASTSNPLLLVFRALAIGVDGGGVSRRQQVKALIRFYVSDAREPNACARIFSSEDLPNPEGILRRPELRDDIYDALKERFSLRLRLVPAGRAVFVLKKEAEIIRAAALRSEMAVLGVCLPHDAVEASSLFSAQAVGQRLLGFFDSVGTSELVPTCQWTGKTRLVFKKTDGSSVSIEFPLLEIADRFVQEASEGALDDAKVRTITITCDWSLGKLDSGAHGDAFEPIE